MDIRRMKGWLFAAAALCCACSPKGGATAQNEVQGTEQAEERQVEGMEMMELPLPALPEGMTDTHERAAYIMEHFWDGMDFADTLRSHNQMFMEGNFVNFLSLFPHALEEALPHPVDDLLARAATDMTAFHLLTGIAEKYLAEPNSPMRNETYYILFLEGTLKVADLPEAERIRPAMQLKTAKKNRPGTKATDFTYTTREGKRQTLYGTSSGEGVLLLVFYDPECSHCNEILRQLSASLLLQELLDEGELTVLAVYTEGKRDVWKERYGELPDKWIVGIDESSIVDKELYDLPAMPIMYLLDKGKTVLLKDPDQNMLEGYLAQ
ncbi:MAG: DUF5106 domain-containing protein [Prevotellaceae bacterium]|nr:DUF5106 domain-containing protein [Prevotellaceae bacterium]